MNAAQAIRRFCKSKIFAPLLFGFMAGFPFGSSALSENAEEHPFIPVREVGGFQAAAAFYSVTNVHHRVCIGIPREGFPGNPAWATRNEHQAAALLRKHLAAKFGFVSSRNFFAEHSLASASRWPIDLSANLGMAGFCEIKSELGEFWNWARAAVMANSPALGTFSMQARMARTPSGNGFWLANPDGKVLNFGDAQNFGSIRGATLNSTVVGMAARPQGDGYWLVTSEGKVFPFGKAPLPGSLLGHRLNQPIVGICPTSSGHGYWLVARDGGVFSFEAPFKGALGATGIENIIGMASTPRDGYWLLGSDGEVFAFEAPFLGSMSDQGFNDFTAIVAKADGSGYWLLRENGAVYTFGLGKNDGFDPTLQCMTALLRKSSLQSHVPAQEIHQYNARIWQTDDGLPQSVAQAVTQTRDGYLWVGTVEGLARFDGVRFRKWGQSELGKNVNASFNALAQSTDGTLYIGAENGGVTQWKNGKFFHFSQTNGLISDKVRSLCAASDGSVWIGTSDGLSHFKNGRFTNYTVTEGLPHNAVRALCEDKEGRIWAATGLGLSCFSRGKLTATYNSHNGLPSAAVRALFVDRNGDLWIGSNGGLTRMREGKFLTYTRNDGLLENAVSAIFEDRRGNLWIGTLGGLNRMVGGKIVAETTESGVFYDWVFSITEDLEGNVWVGMKNGLSRLSPKRFTTYTRPHGLTHNSVMSVFEDRSGTLRIGTWGGGVTQRKDGKFSAFSAQDCLANPLVLAIQQTRDGALWLGLDFDGGLLRVKDGQCREFRAPQGLLDPAVAVIHEDRQGNLWLGTRTALVLMQNEKFTRYTTAEGLPGNNVRVILEDRQGALWIGTTNGLAKFQDGKFSSFTTREGLSSNRINALREDHDGALWIGTAGGGLGRMTKENGTVSIAHFTTRNGLFNDTIFEIVEDRRGHFWLTSPKGVFRVRKRDLDDFEKGKITRVTSVSFGKADGMVSSQCHGIAKPAGCLASDGRLWFPTATGLVSAEPNIKVNETPPPVFIEEVLADKSPATSGPPGAVSQATILPGRGELEFHYTALSFQWPEKNRFKYRLEGIDPDWVEAGTRRVAYYNNIPPGRYLFRVIAANSDGIWNETGASITCVLQPHFWQTWTFKAGMIALGTGLLIFTYQLRMTQVRKIEQLRVRIAADLHDEVGSSLWSISLLSGMLQKNVKLTSEDREDAAEINRIARQTANSVRDIVWFIKPEYDTMQDLVLRMRDVAGTLLAGMEHQFQNSQENMARKLPIDFRQNVFLMYKEILTNVAKHSQATRVEIEVIERNGFWRLCIRDNGIGFDPATESQGSGLKNLRRRAEKLKGTLEVESQKGKRTTTTVSVRFG